MKKAKRKYTKRAKPDSKIDQEIQAVLDKIDPRPAATGYVARVAEDAGRQPLQEGVSTCQVNYGTINYHIYR